ncbi:MAG: hypothetical protein IPM29_24800 [Planctomycetes bacterium]|nr:hypothetical protein [Planctomycetota bacterium]
MRAIAGGVSAFFVGVFYGWITLVHFGLGAEDLGLSLPLSLFSALIAVVMCGAARGSRRSRTVCQFVGWMTILSGPLLGCGGLSAVALPVAELHQVVRVMIPFTLVTVGVGSWAIAEAGRRASSGTRRGAVTRGVRIMMATNRGRTAGSDRRRGAAVAERLVDGRTSWGWGRSWRVTVERLRPRVSS